MSDALINGLAGAGGGIIAQLITYPLQTVNTRQQTERDPKKDQRNLGTLEEMCQVVKREGWERLYGGLMPSLVGTAASQGVYYYFYQVFRSKAEAAALEQKKIGIGDGSVGMLPSLLVAALSGCVNVLLTNPIWVVVTRMQTHRKELERTMPGHDSSVATEQAIISAAEPPPYGTSHVIQEVYGEAGVWGFWKGVLPTLIMFMLYEAMLSRLKRRRALSKKSSDGVTALEIFLLGALAKLGATVVTYPLLVVKARLQARQVKTDDKRHHYKGTWDAIIKMIRYEGFYGFYNGMSTKIVQSVLAAAVLFMVKEELVRGARFLLAKDAVNTAKAKLYERRLLTNDSFSRLRFHEPSSTGRFIRIVGNRSYGHRKFVPSKKRYFRKNIATDPYSLLFSSDSYFELLESLSC
ncbi:peroxisomal nicotinamide adenine dinucleotide carrier isoform X1 [Neltuma alba]|uniref:peroxisomal nicotinamide adenine dinucleotide carrier isoform X1 n=1 Tax=Neltuma alba TaxID=207710 RepID=UPI0010A43BB9|nr:peroxisomal nicotinamide adenine dinucleotide carrier-like isoform X1 [Prosopis alba]